jgi:hypothetical protein
MSLNGVSHQVRSRVGRLKEYFNMDHPAVMRPVTIVFVHSTVDKMKAPRISIEGPYLDTLERFYSFR